MATPPMSGQLGKYQLVAEIARGGMGIVYLSVAQGPGGFSKLLVIKELKAELVDDQSFLDMFLEEARLAARLNHPNIVQTYEVGQDDRRPYIVMDYLDGVTLSRIIRRKSPHFTRDHQLRIICEVLQGLHYAHTLRDFDGTELGIVHRDVTPQNVFVTFDGQAKLVDFGIAKALDTNIETRTGILKGKPAYMAPEQITGSVDPRSDVFSAGVLVWEAVAGQRMWAKKNDVEVLASMLRSSIPSVRDFAPEAPEALVEIIDRSLAYLPSNRYESAAALHAALEDFLATQPPVTLREVSKVITEIFAADRERTRSVIDAHLARLRGGGYVSERVPALVAASEKGAEAAPASTGTPPSETQASPGIVQNTTRTMPYAVPSPTSSPENKRSRAWLPWVLVGGALLVAAVGYGIGWNHQQRNETLKVPPSASASAVASAPKSPEPVEVGSSSKATEGVVSATASSALPRVPPSATASATAQRAVASPVTARAPWQAPRPRATTTAAAPANGAPETRAPDSDKVGYLTLDTYPWTRVSTGGKLLGDTPLVRVPLSVGTHVLTMENAGEKVRTTTTVVVKPGETISKRLAF